MDTFAVSSGRPRRSLTPPHLPRFRMYGRTAFNATTCCCCSASPFTVRFWSETWTSGDTLLTQIVEHLSALRVGRGVHVDDGWRADRDISVALGPWAWAHVQALVEDHGAGRCLVRTRLQLRPRPCAFALAVLTGVVTVVGEFYGGGVMAVALALTALVLMAPIAETGLSGRATGHRRLRRRRARSWNAGNGCRSARRWNSGRVVVAPAISDTWQLTRCIQFSACFRISAGT